MYLKIIRKFRGFAYCLRIEKVISRFKAKLYLKLLVYGRKSFSRK